MTEEDTFRALRRKPLKQVFNEFQNGEGGSGALDLHRFLTKYEWTFLDYYGIYYDEILTEWKTNTPRKEWINRHMKSTLYTLRGIYGSDFTL